ncbi:Alpha/Beta hydrolase protein [Nemania diffusa]|nr:Alpha/Beta hydrolase protein [Nemania diffusa]
MDGQAGKTMWLQDLLPMKLPGCRVMTLQYNASFTSMSAGRVRDATNTLLQLLRDERDDPIYSHVSIVFVGHSLGGIVIKQAISQAHDDSGHDIKKIAKCIKGIVFFGTPHRGSDIANWAALAKRIGGPVIPGPNRGFFHLLQTNSEELYKITEDFRPLSANYAIVSFYEEYPYPTLGKVIVEKDSAIMGLPHERKFMISGTHTSMCRFSKGNREFDIVWKRIRDAAVGV